MDPQRRPSWLSFFDAECAVAAHSRPTLDRSTMDLVKSAQMIGIAICAVGIGALVFYRMIVLHILNRWGKAARGVVISTVTTVEDHRVTYEFAIHGGQGGVATWSGSQLTCHHFQSKDVVAVQYWAVWPRINRIVERAV